MVHPPPRTLCPSEPALGRSGATTRGRTATLAFAVSLAIPGCSSDGGGRPDQDLEGLVHATATPTEVIDVDRAAREVSELGHALALPHHRLAEVVGGHRFHGTSSTVVSADQEVVESLAYDTSIDFDGAGNFHAVTRNDKDYGREVFLVDGDLYLRPRHAAQFHRRPPADADEAVQIRDDLFSAFAASFELLAARAELVDRGHTEVAGRAARKIEIKTAPEPRRRRAETAPQRRWRDDVTVREVTGEVVLDAESGGLLTGKLRGTAVFARDGRTFTLELVADHAITDLGNPITVTAPAADQTVTSIEHHREAEEREVLLEGIAPPARKAPTPPRTGDSETAP